jgi:diguanylate cyclase (GGDEF)-like protein
VAPGTPRPYGAPAKAHPPIFLILGPAPAELDNVDWASYLEPRDRDEARKTLAILTVLAAAVTLLFAVVVPSTGGFLVTLATFLVPLGLLAVSLVLLRAPQRWQLALWAPFPVVAVAAIAGLDLATHDASAAAQVFLCYPVIYAASQLRAPAAAFACMVAVAADAAVVLKLESIGPAISDFFYVSATLLAMSVLLVRAGRRQDALVVELRRQAAIDPLTGLATRRVLDDAVRAALTSDDGGGGTALGIVDVDRFKSVNDLYGHPVGDAALVHIAGVLAEQTRPDTVLCRIGGDEIAFLLPGCSEPVARQRAEHLVRVIRETPMRLPGGDVLRLSVSIGVAHAPHPHDDETMRGLYAEADAALYNAKRAGRDRVGVPAGSPREEPPLTA